MVSWLKHSGRLVKQDRPDIASYYDGFYANKDFQPYPEFVSRRYIRGLLDRSGKARGSRVLDVGCGTGYYSSLFRDLGYNVRGIDVSKVAVDRARRRYPGIRFDVRDATLPPESGEQYDIVFAQGFSCLNNADISVVRDHLVRLMGFVSDQGTLIFVGGSRLPELGVNDGGWYQHSWNELKDISRTPGLLVDGPYATHEYLFLLPRIAAVSSMASDLLRIIRSSRRRRIVIFFRHDSGRGITASA